MPPDNPTAAQGLSRPALAWLYGFVLPHRRSIAGLLVLSLAASALVLVQPYLTKLMIDDGLLAGDFSQLLRIALTLLVVGIISTGLSGLSRYWHTAVSARILFALRESVYRHLQTLSPAFYSRHRSGDILARLDGDVAEIQRFALDGLFAAITGVVGLAGAVGLLFWLQWQLALVVLVLLPLEWAWLRWMRPRVEQGVRRLRERSSQLSSFLVETIGGMKAIQSMAVEEREARQLGKHNRNYLRDLLSLQITEFATQAVPSTLTSSTRALVFIAGGYWVIEGQMQLGSLIAFSTYLGMAVGPVNTLLGLYTGLQRLRVSLVRVQALTHSRPDLVAGEGEPAGVLPEQGEIRLRDVWFTYPGNDQATICGATVHLPAGVKIGLCGPSGTGKTTLVDLLLRHFDPQQGVIEIDGIDLKSMSLQQWRRRVAVVAQDIVLFHASLRENIRYARPDAGEEQVAEAARLAGLQDWVDALPAGLDTRISERGMNISGGQRQRVALARALLQDPVLVILDEATSAVDRAAEAALMAVIEERFGDRTRLVISHRDAPLADVDFLLTIDLGQLHLALGESTPGESTPGESTPGESTPGESTPGEST